MSWSANLCYKALSYLQGATQVRCATEIRTGVLICSWLGLQSNASLHSAKTDATQTLRGNNAASSVPAIERRCDPCQAGRSRGGGGRNFPKQECRQKGLTVSRLTQCDGIFRCFTLKTANPGAISPELAQTIKGGSSNRGRTTLRSCDTYRWILLPASCRYRARCCRSASVANYC